jgi:hypothetical protein
METVHHTHKELDNKTFYLGIGIISFGIIVLQPLTMLAVMLIGSILQG